MIVKKIKHSFLIFFICVSQFTLAQQKTRLNENWEFLKQDLGGIWEAVRPVGKGNPERRRS
jgi:beta-galactosidase